MNNKTLIHSSVLAAIFVAAVIGVSMLTGFPGQALFISVDPVGDKNTGETFTVSGTTSLPAGSEIMFEVVPASLDYNTGMVTDPKTGSPVNVAPYAVTGMLKAGQSRNGIAPWSFTVDSSSFMTGMYRANVFTQNGGIAGNATFMVREGTAARENGQYVRINPIGDRKSGEALNITGTTNLPGGTNLIVEVSPASFETEKPDTGIFSGAIGGVDVIAGSGGINTWSMEVDTSQLQLAKYIVNASVFVSNTPDHGVITSGPFARTSFSVLPGTAAASPVSSRAVAGGILIDPIRDTVQGKLLEVTGRTNLSAGSRLLAEITRVRVQDGSIAADQENRENFAVISVTKGDGINNLFSASFDTRHLAPSDYIITISTVKGTVDEVNSEPGILSGSQLFNIINGTTTPGQPAADLSLPGVFINPVDDVTAGDTIIVTGTTNVPFGSAFLVSVIPDSMDETAINKSIANPKFSTTISAVRGSSTANLFSVPVPTKGLSPGRYILLVSSEKYDVTGSLHFTVI